jgi:glycosyltransferase involved in cell wall biosynthesis
MPSRRPEGSSLSVVEAAAHGRPVIGSDDPAVAEVVERIGAGSIVPAGDPEALAAALRGYLTDNALVSTAGQSGLRGAASQSIAAVTQATRAVYRSVLGTGFEDTGFDG